MEGAAPGGWGRLAVALAATLIALAGAAGPAVAQDPRSALKTVADVRFEGRRAVPERELRNAVKTRRPGRLPWAEHAPLRFDFLRADTAIIAAVYRRHGYLDARARWEIRPRREPQRATVAFIIEEGRRTRIAEVRLAGVRAFKPGELERKLYARPKQPFNPAFLVADTSRISSAYQRRGYIPRVSGAATRESLAARVRYDVHEGPHYRFGEVYMSSPGEIQVPERFVTRELLTKSGTTFNTERIERSIERLYETGLFSQVQITPLPDSSNGTVDLDLRVRERKRSWVDAGVGSGTTARVQSTLEWGQRMVARTGLALVAGGRFALDGYNNFQSARLGAGLVQPWLFGTRTRGTVAVFYEKRDDRNDPRWVIGQDARGLTFGLARDINRFTRLNIIQDNQYIEQRIDFLQSIDPATQDSLEAQTPPEYQTHRLQIGVDRDFRDQPFRPTRGSVQFVTFEFAGGPLKGTSSFGKFQVVSAWFTPLRENVVLAMRFRGGMIRPWEQPPTFTPPAGIDPEVAKIPTEDRYRTGGVNTIRGYAENSIPVGGGLAVLEGSAELRVGLLGPFGLELYVDTGNVWARPEQISWDDFALGRTDRPLGADDLRVTFGVGPRLETPIGPLRVDFSWSLRREPGRSPLVAERQFAIGPSF